MVKLSKLSIKRYKSIRPSREMPPFTPDFSPEAWTVSTLSERGRSSVRSTATEAGHHLYSVALSVGDALRTGTVSRSGEKRHFGQWLTHLEKLNKAL